MWSLSYRWPMPFPLRIRKSWRCNGRRQGQLMPNGDDRVFRMAVTRQLVCRMHSLRRSNFSPPLGV